MCPTLQWKSYTYRNSSQEELREIHRSPVGPPPGVEPTPAGRLLVDEFFSTVPGLNFDMCMISTRDQNRLTL